MKFSRAVQTIFWSGLAVGVLDCFAASLNAAVNGVPFARVWQFVASGLLGKDSYQYGWRTVLLGLSLHFFIAFAVAAVYYFASLQFPVLIRQALWCGALYGGAVYFVMSWLVSPLSRTAKLPFSFYSLLVGILIHIFFVGLPAALITRHFAVKTATEIQ